MVLHTIFNEFSIKVALQKYDTKYQILKGSSKDYYNKTDRADNFEEVLFKSNILTLQRT